MKKRRKWLIGVIILCIVIIGPMRPFIKLTVTRVVNKVKYGDKVYEISGLNNKWHVIRIWTFKRIHKGVLFHFPIKYFGDEDIYIKSYSIELIDRGEKVTEKKQIFRIVSSNSSNDYGERAEGNIIKLEKWDVLSPEIGEDAELEEFSYDYKMNFDNKFELVFKYIGLGGIEYTEIIPLTMHPQGRIIFDFFP